MSENSGIDEIGRDIMSVIVRLFGLALLVAGLWLAAEVLVEAYNLYHEPQRIERFAVAIEKGSNIDKSLVSFRASDEDVVTSPALQDEAYRSSSQVRVSYFFAWMVVLLLMLLIARIALAAVKTGGELVLYDMQLKNFARMVVKEASRNDRS